MLTKALPGAIYELALSQRNTTCVGLVFITMKTVQPGGLSERTELLRVLTTLGAHKWVSGGICEISEGSFCGAEFGVGTHVKN